MDGLRESAMLQHFCVLRGHAKLACGFLNRVATEEAQLEHLTIALRQQVEHSVQQLAASIRCHRHFLFRNVGRAGFVVKPFGLTRSGPIG